MIRFENVTKLYPRQQHPALQGVDLEISRGEFVFLVGASGSGKSTMLRLAIREEQVTDGRLLVGGHDLSRLPHRKVPQLRRQIGSVFQDFRLLPNKTVEQNVAFALQVIGRPRRAIRSLVPETLELVGLEDMGRRYPHELSGGEQQRVAIARAVVNRPPVLLCDEPTGNLDPATSLDIVQLLGRIHDSGTTILMATHDNTIVDRMQQRVVEIEDGVVIRDEATGSYVPKAVDSVQREQRSAVRGAHPPVDDGGPVPPSPDHRPEEDLPRDPEAERAEAERIAEEDAEPGMVVGPDWDDWDEEDPR
ncbi:cell division ATP-binding protein FtsE [Janibacter sp. YIM B02568]|jgi:cell division transport system ATP-binding protein|uniref:cell division ATP-binding protein FtsE n=1 Tax=Janibacter endophyticus TaxID=2806261 RepID=UPI00194F4EF4|nr:cell division ATP-binding protein FtsE [Janibacter endophyticus]MBM6546884.1 cell division ATP-binding protein FtsE [Janibacter endophyticus]